VGAYREIELGRAKFKTVDISGFTPGSRSGTPEPVKAIALLSKVGIALVLPFSASRRIGRSSVSRV
jgi:hypothetical protein